jgi:hydroxymethylpyrimidine/phosphomethylpyrimidine kinase
MADKRAVALTIAGSDPSGGAGLQADLKTFHQFGVYGEAVITVITAQNTTCIDRVECLDPALVSDQIRSVLRDIPPAAAKLGALGCRGIIEAVAAAAKGFDFPLVVDPVMISKHGIPLLKDDGIQALREMLIPLAYLLMPNLPEAEVLAGIQVDDEASMREAARRLVGGGARNVLIKGGHLNGAPLDILLHDGDWFEFPSERVVTRHTHGTGCTHSAAITASLAQGKELPAAVQAAKQYIQECIRSAPGIGHGFGPVNHFAQTA